MSTRRSLTIGIDLGATKIAGALVDGDGRVRHEALVPTRPERGVDPVLDDLAAQIEQLIAAAGSAPVAGVGIGSPGRVDGERGVVSNAVNLGWQEVALVEQLRARLDVALPFWVAKDANASALGEACFGAAQGVDNFVMLTIGSGLGAGVVAGGRLVTGAHWNAAELGHLVLEPGGVRCACGQQGCAETVVSGPGLERLAARLLEETEERSTLPAGRRPTARDVVAAAQAGDEINLIAVRQMGRLLGEVMAACAAVLDPALFVVGGGLGLAAFSWLQPAACSELEKRILPAAAHRVRIAPAETRSSAVGAASLVHYYQSRTVA